MSRPMALGLVLLVLFLTSQSDWKTPKPLVESMTQGMSKKQQVESHREGIKEKIILDLIAGSKKLEAENTQLKAALHSLQEELSTCQGGSRLKADVRGPVVGAAKGGAVVTVETGIRGGHEYSGNSRLGQVSYSKAIHKKNGIRKDKRDKSKKDKWRKRAGRVSWKELPDFSFKNIEKVPWKTVAQGQQVPSVDLEAVTSQRDEDLGNVQVVDRIPRE